MPDKDWATDMVDYVATVTRAIQGPMQAHLRWDIVNGSPRFHLQAVDWFDKDAVGDGREEITLRNMANLVRAVREVGHELGPALFVSRNRGINVKKAIYDKAKANAAAEAHFRLAEDWRK